MAELRAVEGAVGLGPGGQRAAGGGEEGTQGEHQGAEGARGAGPGQEEGAGGRQLPGGAALRHHSDQTTCESAKYRDYRMLKFKMINDLNSPESVPNEHRSRREYAEGGVIVLSHELQVIGVLPLPLCATILKPNLDLENGQFVEKY